MEEKMQIHKPVAAVQSSFLVNYQQKVHYEIHW